MTLRAFGLLGLLVVAGGLPASLRAQSPILLNINDSTYPTPCSVANYQAEGVAGLTGTEVISQFSPAYNVALTSPFTFTNGGQVLFLDNTASAGTYTKASGAGSSNGLMDCYFYTTTTSARTLTVSNLNLVPGTNYTLYLFGTLPVSSTAEDGLFQPVNTADITFASTTAGQGVLAVPFATSASLSSTDVLQFTWAKASTGNGSFQGLAIIPGAPTQTQTLTVTNGVQKYASLANTTVNLSGRCELWVTNAFILLSGCVINLNSTDAWLFFPNVKPSMVVASTYLHQVWVNGAAAVADSNVRVVQYGQNGAVVIPQSSSFKPLTVFNGTEFSGSATSYSQWTYYTGSSITNISSFKLKRGYQAVFAQTSDGSKFSKCYVAQDGDLEIGVLPATLDKQIQFIYVTPWRWTAKKGIAGDPGISQLNVNWWYNWNISSSSSRDLEYVAIEQQPYWPGLSQSWQSLGINTLLGYNEPDNSGQDAYKNLTPVGSVTNAVARLPSLLATGLRLGSAATTDGGRSGWLYPFVSQADAAGYRLDFVAVHYYWCYDPSNPSGAASQMYSFLLDIWNNTHRPIWVTEWNNGATWTTCTQPTYAQQQACVSAMINMLESTPFVERYAFYNWMTSAMSLTTNSVSTGAGLTYSNLVSNLAYSQTLPDNGTLSIGEYLFATNTWDSSGHCNNGLAVGAPGYAVGHNSSAQAIVLDGTNSYVQLPANIAKGGAFTFAGWIYWNGGNNWQRIFDFGSDTSHYLFLTPSSGTTTLRFAINNGTGEQIVERSGALASGSWQHVAVTLGGGTATLYVNGAQVASATGFTNTPAAFSPFRNFLGKSQFSADPLLKARLDEVEITDFALTAAQISALYASTPFPLYTGGVWTNSVGGNWSAGTNWSGGGVASGPGFLADFSTLNILADQTVTLDAARTIGGLRFGDTSGAQNWTLAGPSTLTLNPGATNVTLVAVNQNTATLSAPLAGTNGLAKSGSGTLVLTGTNNLGGGLTVSAGSVNILGGTTAFGSGTSSVGYLTGNGKLNLTNASLTLSGELRVAGSDQSGPAYAATGAVNLASSTLAVGSLTLARANYLDNAIYGTLTVNSGSSVISTNDVVLQYAGSGRGKLALNGGSFALGPTATKWFMIGYYDSGSGELDVTNGSLSLDNGSSIKMCRSGNTGTNLVNQVGGNITFYSDAGATVGGGGSLDLNYAGGTNSCNQYNLNGGTLTVPQIISSAANARRIFNFNGGTLKAAAASSTFVSFGSDSAATANVRNRGAIIDDGEFTITIPQALVHSTIAGDYANDGGLTKLGAGTLTLSGSDTYTGPTTIGAGTLALGSAGSLANSAAISVWGGATLDVSAVSGGFTLGAAQTLSGGGALNGPVILNGTLAPGVAGAIGRLTFSNAPTLNGLTLLKIDRNNGLPLSDQVILPSSAVAFGGTLTVTNVGNTLVPGDGFQLFSAAGYGGSFAVTNLPPLNPGMAWSNSLAVNGAIAVVATVSLTPTNIGWSVSGTNLALSWPDDHSGWRLQVQTNGLAGGLGTNWVDVPGGNFTNNLNLPLDVTQGGIFYRLVFP